MGTVVLDSSVILALFDPEDGLHAPAVDAARDRRRAGDRFVLPASVLAEILIGAARLDEAALDARRDLCVTAFGAPYPVDETVAATAARLRAGHRSLRLPDALVLATAEVVEATRVITGDQRWRGIDHRVAVIG